MIELHEFDLEVEEEDGLLTYVLSRVTLHETEDGACRHAAERVKEDGYGDTLHTPMGSLTGRIWTIVEVKGVKTQIRSVPEDEADEGGWTIPGIPAEYEPEEQRPDDEGEEEPEGDEPV